MKRTFHAVPVLVLSLASGCSRQTSSPAASPPQVAAPVGLPATDAGLPGRAPADIVLFTATVDGAVGLDLQAERFVGFDRSGTRVWDDARALEDGAQPTCLGKCPEVIFSGGYDGDPTPSTPKPRRRGQGLDGDVELTTAYRSRVLTAHGLHDAVLEERDSRGGSWLRLRRADGDVRLPAPPGDYVWAGDPDGLTALTFSRNPTAKDARLLWFRRDAGGWRQVDGRRKRGNAWNACVARGGAVALVVGDAPYLLFDTRRAVPLKVEDHLGECSINPRMAVAVQRSVDDAGVRRTAVRGISLTGVLRWARDFDGEAQVSIHPEREWVTIAHDGTLECLDARGVTLWKRPHIRSALFNEAGELVMSTSGGAVLWTAPPGGTEKTTSPR